MTYINKYIPCNLEALEPTEADLKVGDVVEIPLPLERILGILDQ